MLSAIARARTKDVVVQYKLTTKWKAVFEARPRWERDAGSIHADEANAMKK